MKVVAIIAAAGLGRRMQQDTPKTYLLLAGKPILIHTLELSRPFPRCTRFWWWCTRKTWSFASRRSSIPTP